MTFDYDAFLCCDREDAALVEAIARRLAQERQLRLFLDKAHPTSGEPLPRETYAALARSAACVVFVALHGRSPWAHVGMRFALESMQLWICCGSSRRCCLAPMSLAP